MVECPVCTKLIKACERHGKKELCEKLLKDLIDGKITEDEFDEAIKKNFDVKELLNELNK